MPQEVKQEVEANRLNAHSFRCAAVLSPDAPP